MKSDNWEFFDKNKNYIMTKKIIMDTKSSFKIWHISDTHAQTSMLKIPELDMDDIVIHSGDESNYPDFKNIKECRDFLEWYAQIPCKNKIMIAGNHSAAIFNKWITKEEIESYGIIYLENEHITINDLKIFGTPFTPTFGNWFFMRDRAKMYQIWDLVEEDVDIIISHGPPKGALDLSFNRDGKLEFCGDRNFDTQIQHWKDLKLVCFGHIHNMKGVDNQGILYKKGVYYSNASCVTDGKINQGVSSHGNLFKVENKKITIWT